MITVLNDFRARAKEIDLYFKFLEQIINENALLFFPNRKRNVKSAVDPELQKVLKAHGFLILYNLMESTLKKSIEKIYEKLTNEGLSYKDVRDEIKIQWIEIQYKNFQQKGPKDIFSIIETISDDAISLRFDAKKVIPGNVDQVIIREFAATYGFSAKTHWQAKNGNRLHTVRGKRNDLAHGVVSFADCGKDQTLEDLVKIKKEVILYLKGILKNVDIYISNRQYLKSATGRAA